ncbi:hypothetical protein J2T55_000080 [Methylohalomonas lacus]|uniref:DUF5681 domain-containing protein n=1 Tax=Methylohalomonas lacus TaxID=398773 RepID=A0AAE3HJ33_9GAMM|nr:DUF5681 domain-containing protein [Methylohalomonas lacus]MCS3902088.1 hypothetical protein [Methylohalomonas lacus]
MPKFKKGESGNPSGKPKGAKDKRTRLKGLLEPYSNDLVEKAVELAMDGDTTALKLCLDRLMPPLKPVDKALNVEIAGETVTDKSESVVNLLSSGDLTPEQASKILAAMSSHTHIREMDEIERRLVELEKRLE